MKTLYGFSAGILWADGYFYFSNLNYNSLFMLDVKSGKVKFVTFFPEEKKSKGYLHKKCMRYNDSILFIPDRGEHVHIYVPETKEMAAVKIERFENQEIIFSEAVLKENILIIFPAVQGQPITRICLDDYSCVQDWSFVSWCKENVHTEETIMFGRVIDKDGFVWMAVNGSNQVVCVNLDKDADFYLYSLGNVDLFAIFRAKTGFWLVQRKGRTILHWDETAGIVEHYSADEENACSARYFNYIFDTDFGIYAVPAFAGSIQKLALGTREFHKVFELPNNLEKRGLHPCFFGVEQKDNNLWLFPYGFYQMMIFDMSEDRLYIFHIDDEKLYYAKEPYLSVFQEKYKNRVAQENDEFDLADFLDIFS